MAAKSEVGRQWHIDLTIHQRLHMARICVVIIRGSCKQIAYYESESEVILRMQCTQLLEDGLELSIDVTDDDAARVSKL